MPPQMSAELKKMHSTARYQQLRTQMMMNEILMLASPLNQHRMAELQKKSARTWMGRWL